MNKNQKEQKKETENFQVAFLNENSNIYTKVLRKIIIGISLIICFFYYGLDVERNRQNYGWESFRIIEIICIILLIFDIFYLQIFHFLKLVKKILFFYYIL